MRELLTVACSSYSITERLLSYCHSPDVKDVLLGLTASSICKHQFHKTVSLEVPWAHFYVSKGMSLKCSNSIKLNGEKWFEGAVKRRSWHV